MKTTDNRHYKADDGCLIVRKSDDAIMGDSVDLGSADSIENYEDRHFTEEEIEEFYRSIGMYDFGSDEL